MKFEDLCSQARMSSTVEGFIRNVKLAEENEHAAAKKFIESEERRKEIKDQLCSLSVREFDQFYKANPTLCDAILDGPGGADGDLPTTKEEFENLSLLRQSEIAEKYPELAATFLGDLT